MEITYLDCNCTDRQYLRKLFTRLFWVFFYALNNVKPLLGGEVSDMYRVKKSFNNNIVLVENDEHAEFILLGNGIAFQKKAGDVVDENKIDKRFVLDSEELANKFQQLFTEVPLAYIELTDKIITQAEKQLGVTFNNMLYIGLSDHLRYALNRTKEGIPFPNALLWEIKRFYPNEYQAAKAASKIVNYYEKVWLSEDELGFIALHFVNAQSDSPEMGLTFKMTEIIRTIMTIVQINFKIEIDESTLSYSRFVTHITYFVRRIMQGEIQQSGDTFIFKQLVKKYPETYQCVKQIAQFLKVNSDITLTEEEMIYFIIHINRVISQSKQK